MALVDQIGGVELQPTLMKKKDLKKTQYKLEDRKLPRPVVFWSENEKDAFRRNKVVQTRYFTLLSDIEIQKKATRRIIKYEAHKFRQRSAKYIANSQVSGVGNISNPEVCYKPNEHGVLAPKQDRIPPDSDSDEDVDIVKKNKHGEIVTNFKKSTVKFSALSETTTNEVNSTRSYNEIPPMKHHTCLKSAASVNALHPTQQASSPLVNSLSIVRSKSFHLDSDKSKTSANKTTSFKNFDETNIVPVNQDKPINSYLYFDRSLAAFHLRKELQRLARIRKNGKSSPVFNIQDFIRHEKEKYDNNRLKVVEYLRKLDDADNVTIVTM